MIKKIVHSVAWSSLYRLSGILAAFLVNVLLARLMDKKELGLYFITFSLVMFLAILMRAGIKQTVLKNVAWTRNNGGDVAGVIKKIIIITISTTLMISIAILAGAGEIIAVKIFKSTLMSENIGLVVLWAAMIAMAAPIGETLRALHFPGWGAAMDMALNNIIIMIAIAIGYLMEYPLGYVDVLFLWSVASVVVNILALMKLTHHLTTKKLGNAVKAAMGYRRIFSGLMPIFILNLSTYLMINASLWTVGNMLGHEDAAIYGAVLKLYNLLALPLLIINLGLEPHIADMFYSEKKNRLTSSVRLSATAGFYVTFMMSLLFIGLGEDILRFTYGVGFEAGTSALLVILGGNVINVWTGSCASMLIISGKEKILSIINLIGAIVCVVVGIYMAPRYGIVGVSAAVAVAVASVNLTLWHIVNRHLGINTSALINPIQIYKRLIMYRHVEA